MYDKNCQHKTLEKKIIIKGPLTAQERKKIQLAIATCYFHRQEHTAQVRLLTTMLSIASQKESV